MECDVCQKHSGVEARLDNLEKENVDLWNAIEKRFTQILLAIILMLVGLVANYLKT
jgi:hypothetical protein